MYIKHQWNQRHSQIASATSPHLREQDSLLKKTRIFSHLGNRFTYHKWRKHSPRKITSSFSFYRALPMEHCKLVPSQRIARENWVRGDLATSCLSRVPLFQSESWCEAFHMEISFIHRQNSIHLHVNKTTFHMKRLCVRTRFETEAKCNSQIAYSVSVASPPRVGWSQFHAAG